MKDRGLGQHRLHYEATGRIIVRTPLMAHGEVFERSHIGTLVTDGQYWKIPAVNEALWLASREFYSLAMKQLEEGTSLRSSCARALYKYASRMAGRPTPFGLFAGVASAQVGAITALRVMPRSRYRRRTRVDMGFMGLLCAELTQSSDIRSKEKVEPNSSIYHLGDHFKLAAARQADSKTIYEEVKIEASAEISHVLAFSAGGATVEQIAESLAKTFPGVTLEDAKTFVHELVDSQVLVPNWLPTVTGQDGLKTVIDALHAMNERPDLLEALESVEDGMKMLDDRGVGVDQSCYQIMEDRLRRTGVTSRERSVFQVDLFKPLEAAVVGQRVIDEVLGGLDVLWRMTAAGSGRLADFKRAFRERYEEREVPLTEALDEETGIGLSTFQRQPVVGSIAPGLSPRRFEVDNRSIWTSHDRWLLERLEQAWARGVYTLEVNKKDLDTLEAPSRDLLPNTLGVTASVAAKSESDINQGRFQVYLMNASGPSGARLLGRFCAVDRSVHESVANHIAAEQASRPDAIFAEIVHIPEGRLGNVIRRPVLRAYEIPYLGRSGAEPDRQIPITDLVLCMRAGRLVLLSSRLKKEVIPRLTSAHNYWHSGNVPIYRFLGLFQSQDGIGTLKWRWGSFESAAFLPRVTCGKVVFARATWRIRRNECDVLGRLTGAERREAVEKWRTARKMPRYVYISEGENELLIDLSDDLAVEVLLRHGDRQESLQLVEMFPDPQGLWLAGPEGGFVHEFIIPCIRRSSSHSQTVREEQPSDIARGPSRVLMPGSECVMLKVYCGPHAADELLVDTIGPTVDTLVSGGYIDRWFFIRYADPSWHLRVRVFGERETLLNDVLPRFQEGMAVQLERGRIWRVQYDTYEREVERYGGGEGILAAERLFCVDSIACVNLLRRLRGSAFTEVRWRGALLSADGLLNDLGYDVHRRMRLSREMRDGVQDEFELSGEWKRYIASQYRKEASVIGDLLLRRGTHEAHVGIREVYEWRSREWGQEIERLKLLESEGALTRSLRSIAASLIHMQVNRILQSDHRAQEVVLYHFLCQGYSEMVHGH